MKSYACVLFDLDHTLWDYEANAEETLRELYSRYRMEDRGVTSFRYFLETFRRVNLDLWDRYDRGLIGQEVIRTERFDRVFRETGVEDTRGSLDFSATYLRELPRKKNLLPQAREILDYLAQGLSNKAIARALDISHDTVKLHVRHILSKLNLTSRVEAAVFAVEHKSGKRDQQAGGN